jgi:hypothetical protein
LDGLIKIDRVGSCGHNLTGACMMIFMGSTLTTPIPGLKKLVISRNALPQGCWNLKVVGIRQYDGFNVGGITCATGQSHAVDSCDKNFFHFPKSPFRWVCHPAF